MICATTGLWAGYSGSTLKAVMTLNNREWLAQMSDNELACWLDKHIDACCVCSHKKGNTCEIPDNGYDCLRGRLAWLKMEHKEEQK
jgi:hypothetical protein